MALKATILKAQLQVSDMDRNHFQEYPLTLAQHPSETDARVMVRLLAFALHAAEGDGLQFGSGLSSDEPDLWRKDLTGDIELWVEVGQPEEAYIRRACGRSRQVAIYNYSGRSAQVWWDKCGESLQRSKNLTVIEVDPDCVAAIARLAGRSMQIQCFIQDGAVHLMGEGDAMVPVTMNARMGGR